MLPSNQGDCTCREQESGCRAAPCSVFRSYLAQVGFQLPPHPRLCVCRVIYLGPCVRLAACSFACPVFDMSPILHGCLPACRSPALPLRSSQVQRRS